MVIRPPWAADGMDYAAVAPLLTPNVTLIGPLGSRNAELDPKTAPVAAPAPPESGWSSACIRVRTASVRYLHIVPQLIREPDRSVGRVNDPYGGDFLEQIALGL